MNDSVPHPRPPRASLAILMSLTFGGCGDNLLGPPATTYPVRGRVLLADGRPLTVGVVSFVPQSETSVQAVGKISPKGEFELTTRRPGDGAAPGFYRVKVDPFAPGDGTSPVVRPLRPRVPLRYLDEDTSKLIVTIKSEPNQDITIQLK